VASGGFAAGLIGIVLDDRYRLDAVLGEGGMGAVFRAHQLAMDRKVAVKLLKPHLAADAAALQRFMREARATLKVDSPHAVKVLDFGITPHGDYYIALEYLDGRTVQRELDIDGPFAPARVIHIARQALDALAASHRSGLVHRDLKPDNILLMRVGADPDYAKLLDFGVAKLMEGTATSEHSRLALTQAGTVFGTPQFMSPEQACGHALDGRSDLYSLAATMFAMLTGCGLFEGKTAIEWLTHHARTPPPHLAMVQPELAAFPALDDLIQRCLSKHREARPRTAEELAALLAQLEPYVRAGGGAPPPPPGHNALEATLVSDSGYIDALPQETVDPGSTLLPPRHAPSAPSGPTARSLPRARSEPSTIVASDSGTTATTSGLLQQVGHGRRGLYLALGGIAVLAMLAIAIGVAMRGPASRSASRSADSKDVSIAASDAAGAPPVPDAPVALVAAPPDAATVPAIDGGVAAIRVRPTSAADAHLKNAEEAMRDNNRLRQLAEADLALKSDPRNVRATYLLADALIKTGDLDRGCAYLRALGRNQLASARAIAAKCPID
jgi:serine/threonine protein kinase